MPVAAQRSYTRADVEQRIVELLEDGPLSALEVRDRVVPNGVSSEDTVFFRGVAAELIRASERFSWNEDDGLVTLTR